MKFGVAIPCLKHFQNNVSCTVLLRMGLLCRADDYVSDLACAALCAMTGPEGESTVMLFGIVMQLLKPYGAIRILEDLPIGTVNANQSS